MWNQQLEGSPFLSPLLLSSLLIFLSFIKQIYCHSLDRLWEVGKGHGGLPSTRDLDLQSFAFRFSSKLVTICPGANHLCIGLLLFSMRWPSSDDTLYNVTLQSVWGSGHLLPYACTVTGLWRMSVLWCRLLCAPKRALEVELGSDALETGRRIKPQLGQGNLSPSGLGLGWAVGSSRWC